MLFLRKERLNNNKSEQIISNDGSLYFYQSKNTTIAWAYN